MNEPRQESQEFWRHAAFRELGLLKARFREHRYDRHTHDGYVIALITEGCERVRVGRQEVLAPAGSVLVVNPEEWHDGEAGADEGWAYRTFYPSVALLSEIATELGQTHLPLFPQALLDDPELCRLLTAAHTESASSEATRAETSLLTALRRLILQHGDNDRPAEPLDRSGSQRRFSRYEQLIEDGLAGEIDLQGLAAAASVTRFQVIRDFKKLTGSTPATFIRDRRLRRANRLIQEGLSLADAAFAAGFADQSHLSRSFRAVHGITPGMFRKAG
ncbi:AraC family transcriptional regulator [Bosea vestrisii]|uniref:AraC family transcriptional regulator n=1 Tax=Bosea vestrisii TaxID=151416 RepID=UPI0024DFC5DE|nr:AraC family transcriptional regulator [Bosea vestrisii]WID98790.1 AraC family transcriptional regulator [Bosea vestrisii]